MIPAFFILLFTNIVLFIFSFLPVYDIPSQIGASITLFWSYLNIFSFLFPVGTYLSVFIIAVLFETSMLGYNLFLKIYHMFRG